jgi:hypothetical protein
MLYTHPQPRCGRPVVAHAVAGAAAGAGRGGAVANEPCLNVAVACRREFETLAFDDGCIYVIES